MFHRFILEIVFWVIAIPLLVLTMLEWLTETRTQQIRRLRREGHSIRSIAATVGCTQYRVRRSLSFR
jgi:hypothetical protein